VESSESLNLILAFLNQIGIPYAEKSLADGTFLPGVTIDHGGVHFDRTALVYPGDVLHEAGHIALTPPDERGALDQAVLDAQPATESLEIGVLLWTFLAAKEIGLPIEMVFHAGGYKDGSTWITDQFESGNQMGLPLLNWMGVTEETTAGIRVKNWLRPHPTDRGS
jgi:hypothetical protein